MMKVTHLAVHRAGPRPAGGLEGSAATRSGDPVIQWRHPGRSPGPVGDPDGVLHHLVARPHLLVVAVGPVELHEPATGVEVRQVGVAHVGVARVAVLPGARVAVALWMTAQSDADRRQREDHGDRVDHGAGPGGSQRSTMPSLSALITGSSTAGIPPSHHDHPGVIISRAVPCDHPGAARGPTRRPPPPLAGGVLSEAEGEAGSLGDSHPSRPQLGSGVSYGGGAGPAAPRPGSCSAGGLALVWNADCRALAR